MKYKFLKSITLSAAALAASVSGTQVFAQQGDGTSLVLEELIVTARKREETLQDIPLSITAFSADDIREAGIASVDDVAKFTPGLHISNFTGDRDDTGLRFRGMDNSTRQRDRALSSAFVDGVYLPGSSQWVSTNDIQQIEVVKGPQSAFFGRGTFGGAVNFITKTPSEEFGGDISIEFGENGRQDIEASIEGSLVQDVLTGRLSVRAYEYDGGFKNNHPSGGRLGSQSTDSFSATLNLTPTENLSMKLYAVHSEDDDGPGVFFTTRNSSNNCGPFFDPADPQFAGITPRNYFCGELSPDLLPGGTLGYDTTINLNDPALAAAGLQWPKDSFGLDREVDLLSLIINYDIGDYTLTSVTGAYEETQSLLRDFQGYQPGNLLAFSAYKDETFSQEIRLTSPEDNRFRWVAGLYYLDLTFGDRRGGFGCADTSYINCLANPLFPGAPFSRGDFFFGASARGAFGGLFGSGTFETGPDRDIENKAVFGSISYDVTDNLTLSLEVRRGEDELVYEPVVQAGTGNEVNLQGTFKSTTPRFIVDYKPNEDTTIYFNYAEGNQPGNFNPDVARINPSRLAAFTAQTGAGVTIEEGELKNYEIGLKKTLLDNRAFLNIAAYYMEWDEQVFTSFLRNFDSNGDGIVGAGDDTQIDYGGNGSSEIKGIDIAANLVVNEYWTLGMSYNYNDTELTTFEESNFQQVFGTRDASGNELPRSPKNSLTLNASLDMPTNLFGGGSFFGRVDVSYTDGTYAWVNNLAETGDITNVNLRAGWRNERYSLGFWVENLTDQDELSASRRFTDLGQGGNGFSSSLTKPREFGVTFEAKFGAL